MLLSLLRVSGHSMIPTIRPGNSIVISSFPYLLSLPKRGDIVVVRRKKTGKMLVKRIDSLKNDKLKIVGDNKDDSLDIGTYSRQDIVGKVVLIIR